MKLRSLQGYFGNMNGRKVDFSDGFSHLILPNGWGKSTLCAFLRVMLYGLNLTRRDTEQVLSDQSKYMPQDGHAMSGQMEVEWNGRVVTIVRQTGKGGPMQDFDAFYTDSGEKCRLLTAKNCGQVLLGMGEDAFLSSMMVNGEDIKRPSSELQELFGAMARTGDATGSAAATLGRLHDWQTDIQSEDDQGQLPVVQREQAILEKKLTQLESLTHEIEQCTAQYRTLNREATQAQNAYQTAHQDYIARMAEAESRRQMMREEREQRIQQLRTRMPDETVVREAGEILYGYEGAVRLEREKREHMPALESRRRQAVEQMERARLDREIEVNRVMRPKIRWVAGAFAFIFAVLAAITGMLQVEWFPEMGEIAGMLNANHLPIVLSVLAIICLLLTFLGSVQKPPAPLPDMDEKKKELDIEYQRILDEQQMAAQVLIEARDHVIEAGRRLSPDVQTVEQAAEVIRSAIADLQLIRREQSALGDVMLGRPNGADAKDVEEQRLDALHERQMETQQAANRVKQHLMDLREQADEIGVLQNVRTQLSACRERVATLQKQYQAIKYAKEVIQSENDALQARVSPQITALAQTYLAYLTADNYREIGLDDRLRTCTVEENGHLLNELQLSSSARDQLYLALRLAICETLASAKEAPLILDNPFLTSDDSSTERGIALLKELGHKRQVILLTC